MSSGEVGSSIQYGSKSASLRIQSMAWSTPQRWLASMAKRVAEPAAPCATLRRRMSSSMASPTLSFTIVKPVGHRGRDLALDLLVVVAEPAWRGRVGGQAVRQELLDSRCLAVLAARAGGPARPRA